MARKKYASASKDAEIPTAIPFSITPLAVLILGKAAFHNTSVRPVLDVNVPTPDKSAFLKLPSAKSP